MSTVTLTSERDRDVLRSFARRIDPSDAGAHNNLGVLYYNKGLHEEAVQAFMRALELDPKMQVAQRNLEIAYFQTGYYDRRVGELREVLRQDAANRDARWELGRTYALLNEHAAALAEFTELLRHHAEDLGALVQLGLAEKAIGDLDDAMRWFDRALVRDPQSSTVHFYRGEVLYNKGLNDEALAALARSVELNPENADAHFLTGFVLGDIGRHEEAKAATRRAMQLNPSLGRAQANLSLDRYNAQTYEQLVPGGTERRSAQMMAVSEDGQLAHYNLGVAFRQKGYYQDALKEYRIALERGEERDLVRQAMAEVYLLTRDVQQAVAMYDEALRYQPASPKLWNERGVALHQDGRFDDAAASYKRAIEADGRYPLAWNNLGVALYHGGEGEDSIDAFRRALEIEATFVKARLNLALLLYKKKRLQLALEAYRHVLGTEPEHPVAWNGIGLVLAELKRYEEARAAFARAIQSRPDYAEAHYNVSFTLSNLGDFEGALRETKRALELDPYYVAQKFELAIDLMHEDPDFSIIPDLGGERRTSAPVQEFSFDSRLLDSVFSELSSPAAAPAVPEPVLARPYASAEEFLAMRQYERASSEAQAAMGRGADRAEGLVVLGDVFAARGLHGEALERYGQALALAPTARRALLGRVRALLALGRGRPAREAADALLVDGAHDVDALVLAADARMADGDAAAALEALANAGTLMPNRADLHKRTGDALRAHFIRLSATTKYSKRKMQTSAFFKKPSKGSIWCLWRKSTAIWSRS